VYQAGDRIRLRVYSTRKKGTAYIDAVRQGHTVLTRDIDLNEGQGELIIPATPEMAAPSTSTPTSLERTRAPLRTTAWSSCSPQGS
jgi:hypothetical protein